MKRILIVRPDRVGDVVISSSVLAPVRKKYPEAKIFWMTQRAQGDFFENHPAIDEWLEIPGIKSGSFFTRVAAIREKIEAVAPDVLVALDPRADLYVAAWRAQVPRRMGWKLKRWSWTLTEAWPEVKRQGLKHEGGYNFDLLNRMGVPTPAALQPQIAPVRAAQQTLREKFPWLDETTPYAVLNPSAFSPIARWAPKNFAQVGDWLHRTKGFRLVVIGDKAEDDSAITLTQILQEGGHEVKNLAGRTSLAELAWLLERAKVLVTRDTGPSHVAAAMGCPVVVIFGRTAPIYGPKRWAPLTDRLAIIAKTTERKRWETNASYWRRCFEAITVEEVRTAVESLLSPDTSMRK